MMKFRRQVILLSSVAILSVGGLIAHSIGMGSNTHFTEEYKRFFIPFEMTDEDVIAKLSREGIIERSTTLRWYLKLTGDSPFRPGRYKIYRNANNADLVNMFRAGDQELVDVRVRHLRDVSRIAGRLAQYLRADSASFADYLLDPVRMDSAGFNRQTWPSFFLAATYTMRWTDSPATVFAQFKNAYHAYWTAERKAQASKSGYSPEEVYTLASIVKGEAMKTEEAARIAGLYMNRLRIGMALQADPTIVFALGLEELNQVTFEDLNVNSPYNTYRNVGLPPGPILITEAVYLDAILEPETHNFLYMCAKPGAVGEHAFARTFDEHLKNAEAYRKWRKESAR